MTDDDRKLKAVRRYTAALHAVQSGVAYNPDKTSLEPKHLRVGISSAHVTDKAIAKLLIEKGVITEVEYHEAVADAMEEERDECERRLTEAFGRPIKLL